MRIVMKPRIAIVFLVVLTLSLSLGSLAEDIPETAFDESEPAPFEAVPLFSIVALPVADRIPQHELSWLHPEAGAPSLFAPARVHNIDATRSAETRVSLTPPCTLLC